VANRDWCRTLAVGAIAGVAGAIAMNLFSYAIRPLTEGNKRKSAPGTDRDVRTDQPEHAEHQAEDDATVRAGTAVYQAITGGEPTREGKVWLGRAAHYGFGLATGVGYALLSSRAPSLRRGFGTTYGTLVWAIADEGAVPVLGLSKGPREVPLGVHADALGAHLVYGATLEGIRRLASRNRSM